MTRCKVRPAHKFCRPDVPNFPCNLNKRYAFGEICTCPFARVHPDVRPSVLFNVRGIFGAAHRCSKRCRAYCLCCTGSLLFSNKFGSRKRSAPLGRPPRGSPVSVPGPARIEFLAECSKIIRFFSSSRRATDAS